jgi:DNA repair protein RecN (Recombination protein N)
MLQSLRIRNLALLEEVSLDFEAGFTVVTGETGAGKSILLGALSLLAGERAEKTIIRQGAAACEVEASLLFSDPTRIDAVLAELELPATEDGVLLLRRTVPREKAPKITVNGSLATLAALHRLGEVWIDFHGPSEPRRLLREGCQLELLDLFGRAADARQRYRGHYQRWRGLLGDAERVRAQGRLSPDQLTFLQNELARLDLLDLTAESIEALERDFQRMNRAQELTGLAASLSASLTGEEGVTARVAALVREARALEAIDPASAALADRLASASFELADLGAEFESLGQSLNFDAEQAESLTARMNSWLEARRRHGPDVASVAAAREELRARLESQGDVEGTLARLEAEFLFSPNVGEAPLPLNRIASSGELARVMLALKTVLADLDDVPVLVFDEVDANVGGEIGRVVGEKMALIARTHQVLCVTHLPQVAAQGNSHLVVVKDQTKDRAVVTIEPLHLDRKARVGELARMLGDRTAKSALAHAEELLKSAS